MCFWQHFEAFVVFNRSQRSTQTVPDSWAGDGERSITVPCPWYRTRDSLSLPITSLPCCVERDVKPYSLTHSLHVSIHVSFADQQTAMINDCHLNHLLSLPITLAV